MGEKYISVIDISDKIHQFIKQLAYAHPISKKGKTQSDTDRAPFLSLLCIIGNLNLSLPNEST